MYIVPAYVRFLNIILFAYTCRLILIIIIIRNLYSAIMLLGGYRDSRENPNSQIAEIAGLDIDGLEKSGRENGGLPAL